MQLPLAHPLKGLKVVVATVSLGVGVDLRVKNVVSFGLGSTPEDTVQEAGRCLRGNSEESQGMRGLAFFFQKGSVAAIHCKPTSDCRSLITDPLPKCQTNTLYRFFDADFEHQVSACLCCYSCILRDANHGCQSCSEFLETYLSHKRPSRLSRSIFHDLKVGIQELFRGLGLSSVAVESKLQLSVENFIDDFIKAFDEIQTYSDIIEMWHIDENLAKDLFDVCSEVLECDEGLEISPTVDSESDSQPSSSESSCVTLSDFEAEDDSPNEI